MNASPGRFLRLVLFVSFFIATAAAAQVASAESGTASGSGVIVTSAEQKSPVIAFEAEVNGKNNEGGVQATWWNDKWDYRVPLSTKAPDVPIRNKPAEISINFTDLLKTLAVEGQIDQDSFTLLEVDANGKILAEGVPFQFDRDEDFDSETNFAGTLIVLLEGQTAAKATRTYYLYFDVLSPDETFSPQPVATRVATKDNVSDAGFESLKITTETGTYFYHKDGGGFSSLIDTDGKDWINYSSAAGAAGDFRGIPNMVAPLDGGYFHPGRSFSSNPITTELVGDGKLKSSFVSMTKDGAWQVLWEVYPSYARLTVLKAPAGTGYWFLYEGTPGGSLEPDSDYVVRSDGMSTLTSAEWETELSDEEWVYFSEGSSAVTRSLFAVHHEDDASKESYRPMNGLMTVFGFGRLLSLNKGLIMGNQHHFTIGLIDEESSNSVGALIRSAYKDAGLSLGSPERRPYYLSVNKIGKGAVDVSPSKDAYQYGDKVELEARPEDGWRFLEWAGDASGSDPTVTLTIVRDLAISASFGAPQYLMPVVLRN